MSKLLEELEAQRNLSNYLLLEVIKVSLPGAFVKYCENFDDMYWGFDICPEPGALIRFKIGLGDQYQIRIDKYKVIVYDDTLLSSTIFKGTLPSSDGEPDYQFVRYLLQNWHSIS